MKTIDFYIGVLPESRQEFIDFTHVLNEGDNDPSYHVYIKDEFNNPEGYHTFSLKGTWRVYNLLRVQGFTKSIEHFEDDLK